MAKIDEKELNTPNLFLVKARRTLDYLIENRKRVFLAVGVAVGVVLIAVSWYLYRLDYESKAQKLYAAAFNYYHSAQTDYAGDAAVPQSVEKYREVVEKFPGTKAPASPSSVSGMFTIGLQITTVQSRHSRIS